MKTHFLSIGFSSVLVLSQSLSAQAGPAGIARPDFTETRQLIRDWMAKDSLPGLAIAIARGDSILWEEGFGWANREARVPVTPHTPFYLASLTKTITATAAMLLRERGRLDLDRAANAYLGSAGLWSPRWDANAATVRKLAQHMAGLSTFDLGCPAAKPRCRLPSFEELMRRYGVLVWEPGEHYDYSNLGYKALGEVVAKAAGKDLRTFLRDDLFRPLGMMHSSLDVDPRYERETAVQYHWVHGPLTDVTPLESGASSVYSSAHDLMLFGALHTKTRTAGKRPLLSDASIDTMQYSVVRSGANSLYGIGWSVEADRFGYRSLLAQGGNPTASAWLRVIPSEQISIAVLANKGVGFPGDVIDAALAAMLPRYAELRAAQLAKASANTAPVAVAAPANLDSAFVGEWQGIVRAEGNEIPLRLAVSDSGTLVATLGSGSRNAVGRARFANTLFRFTLGEDAVSPDATAGRQLSFYLRKRNDTLYGTVTTFIPIPTGLEGRVSYWVELRKR